MSSPPLSDLVAGCTNIRVGVVGTYDGQDLVAPLEVLGIQYHGEHCRELKISEARLLLADLFAREMPQGEAEAWADRILTSVFPRDAKLLTNVTVNEPSKVSSYARYFSGTESTFSVGIVAVTPQGLPGALACVWVEDE